MEYRFVKLNDEPIKIEYVEDEHEEENDFKPSFWWNNCRKFLENFTKTHNNPWIGESDFPEHIHGMEDGNYYSPLFIELIGDEAVNVYEERKALKFDWGGFTKEQFARYCDAVRNGTEEADDCIGCVRAGELSFDLITREYEAGKITLSFDVYVGDVDTGYRYSTKEALASGKYGSKYEVPDAEQHPYDYADGDDFEGDCTGYTYEEFRSCVEEKMTAFVDSSKYAGLQAKAEAELHVW